MKTCQTCKVDKPLSDFNKHRGEKDGHKRQCRQCQSIANAARYAADPQRFKTAVKQYQTDNLETVVKKRAEHYVANRDRVLAQCSVYAKANRERRTAYRAAYRRKNLAREHVWRTNWRHRNMHVVAARVAARNAAKRRAIPAWADREAIKEIYRLAKRLAEMTGMPWHVDHVVPLRSPIVCGFHCEANLEPTLAVVNVAKSNRYWPDMPT